MELCTQRACLMQTSLIWVKWPKHLPHLTVCLCWLDDLFSPQKRFKMVLFALDFFGGGINELWFFFLFFPCSLFAQHTELASEACGPLGVAGCQYIYRDSKSTAVRRLWHCQVRRGCCPETSQPCACCLLITFWVIKYCFNQRQLPFHLRFWKFLRWQELTRTTVVSSWDSR